MKLIKKLLSDLKNTKGKEKIELLNKISASYSRIDLNECLQYAKMALKLSEDIDFYKGKAVALKNMSLYNFFKGNYAISESYLKRAIDLAKSINNEEVIAEFNLFYATLLRTSGEFEKSYKKCMLAYNFYEKDKNYEGMANTLNIIGILHKFKNDNSKALEYYKKALSIAAKINKPEIIANIRNNIGTIYRVIGEYDKAIDFFDKAIDYFKDSGNKLALANGLNNISITYESKKDYENAKKYNRKAYTIFKELDNKNGIILSEYNLADISIKTHEYEKAEELFLKAIKFYSDTKNIQMLKNCYFSMYELNKERKKDAVALQYYEKFHDVEMKILSKNERKHIAELEAKFELLEKEKQLIQIKQDNIALKNMHHADTLNLEKLQLNKDFYELILENSHSGIMIIDINLNFIYANKLFYKMLDVKNENVTNLADIFDKKTINKMLRYKENIINMGTGSKEYYLETVTVNGKRQNLEINISQFKNNKGNWILLAHLKDVTESYKKDERLRLLMRAFEQSPTVIAITDTSGKIKYVNPKFTELTGYSEEEVIEKNPRILKSDKPNISYKDLWEKISAGKDWNGIFYNKRKDGRCYWEHARISPVWDNSGNVTHYIKIAEDITEKKKSEEKIKKLVAELEKANASKDKFFSIIAHDLKSPFATISAFVNIMRRYYDKYDKEKLMRLIDELDKSVKNTYALLENLLTWSRMQSSGMEYNPINFDLNPIILKIIKLYELKAAQKGILLKYNLTDDKNYVYADMFMIETTIRNLVNNAMKFTPEGGEIIVGVDDSDKFYTVSVKDTGIGISKENIKNLFSIDTAFSTYGTNNEKGTGLGLILCKDFVERNNGKIYVESEEGKGTRFYFTIPQENKNFISNRG